MQDKCPNGEHELRVKIYKRTKTVFSRKRNCDVVYEDEMHVCLNCLADKRARKRQKFVDTVERRL